MPTKGSRVILAEPGASRKANPALWYHLRREHINKIRRRRDRKNKKKLRAQRRQYYKDHPEKFLHLTPLGKYIGQLKRKGMTEYEIVLKLVVSGKLDNFMKDEG